MRLAFSVSVDEFDSRYFESFSEAKEVCVVRYARTSLKLGDCLFADAGRGR